MTVAWIITTQLCCVSHYFSWWTVTSTARELPRADRKSKVNRFCGGPIEAAFAPQFAHLENPPDNVQQGQAREPQFSIHGDTGMCAVIGGGSGRLTAHRHNRAWVRS